ncbi:MAG: type VI secretion system baseplate subunit TssG [Pseudomonadota bacterium]
MAAVDRLNGHALPAILFEQADCYDFVQLVRLLDRHAPGRVALGAGSDPAREGLSFRAKVGFGFSTSDVLGAVPQAYADRARVDVAFMGLAGNEGPLPTPYAELVLQRSRPTAAQHRHGTARGQPDDDARDFLDIFNHRLLSYFYRGRKKHSIAVGADAGAAVPLFERMLFQLIGFPEGVHDAGARVLLRYAGILAHRHRALGGLETMLADAFGTVVRGTQHQGRWLEIAERFQSTIGPDGRNRALGRTTVLGRRAWDARGKITLAIGPLPLRRYEALLPGGSLHSQLVFMVRFYLREDVDVDVALTLAAPEEDDSAAAELPKLGHGRLARTAWLGPPAPRQVRGSHFALGRWRAGEA